MQKLIWQNSLGTTIDLTKSPYGITNWEGFANAPLNIQSQQVPFQDGRVFLDALIEQRDLTVTLAIYDGNDLEKRYELRRELIHTLNPKLGEGYLIYTNDFISKRIKCIAQIPMFENHNSNDPGTPKASLSWTACEPYWEDLEEKSVSIMLGGGLKIFNEGDVKISPSNIYIWGNGSNVTVKNISNDTQLKINGEISDVDVTLETGHKDIRKVKQYLSFLNGGWVVETEFAQYIASRDNILKTSDFVNIENVKQFSTNLYDMATDGKNVYVAGGTFFGMIDGDGNYFQRSDIEASKLLCVDDKIYVVTRNGPVYSFDNFNATPVTISSDYPSQIMSLAKIGNDILCCGLQGMVFNLTQNESIPNNAGTKALRCIAPYKNGYAILGDSGFAQYNNNGTWGDIPLEASVALSSLCYNNYTGDYYFGGENGYLALIRKDGTKEIITTNLTNTITVFFSKIFGLIELAGTDIAFVRNQTEVEIILNGSTHLLCCKYVDYLGKYVAGGIDSIYTSSDFKQWERVFYQEGAGNFIHVESDNRHVIVGNEDEALYESTDGNTFTPFIPSFEKYWVTYNTVSEKFYFVAHLGTTDNDYWVCEADNLGVSFRNVRKLYHIDGTTWTTYETNSASCGSTTVFILSQENNANPILFYTMNAGETWNSKISSSDILNYQVINSLLSTYNANNKILITLNKMDYPGVSLFAVWDETLEDFVNATIVSDRNYLVFQGNYATGNDYACGLMEGSEPGSRVGCIVKLSVEGTTITITNKLDGESIGAEMFVSAMDLGDDFYYSYTDEHSNWFAYYNNTLWKHSPLLKWRGHVVALEEFGETEEMYFAIYDNNRNEIARLPYRISEVSYVFALPTDDSILMDERNESYAYLTPTFQLIIYGNGIEDCSLLFNYNGKIYIVDNQKDQILDENGEMVLDVNDTVLDCKISDDNLLYISLEISYAGIDVYDEHFQKIKNIPIDVTRRLSKIYPFRNGDIIGFDSDKKIYKYNHLSESWGLIYQEASASVTLYDIGFYEDMNEAVILANAGMLFIIDRYVGRLINLRYTSHAFVKNRIPMFVGFYGFNGTLGVTKEESLIHQVEEMTLKLNVGENNLVFSYDGEESMMMSVLYNPKYIGV